LDVSVQEKALTLHQNCLVLDAHCDIPLDIVFRRRMGEKRVFERLYFPKSSTGGVNACCMTVWCDDGGTALGSEDQPFLMAVRTIESMYREFDESPDRIFLARSVSEIKQSKRERALAVILHLEGGMPLGNDLDHLQTFYNLGVRSVGLTHSGRNLIADGCRERSNSGLSDFGVEVVRECNRLGMIVDVSHLSMAGFYDVMKFSKEPAIASHSNSRSLCDHHRNLTDEQIKALAGKGGVMGLCACPDFVTDEGTIKRPTFEELLNHVDHVRDLVGVEHIGVGADFVDWQGPWYVAETLPPFPERFENWTMMPNLTQGLLQRGYADDDIEMVLGGNFLRVYEKVLAP
jgi:membrane dipeptidase